ncbi:hypothetical protein PGTUg99_007469 [Puccinia graminis f. sp. tritici]|uniref:Uncharacterized protein n=1 Tax=Puccinia graminis f. sp. tritici TaxID=56615 RepID=A0A5B0SI11_PUCGR|nr:hypothetical protein PGTUg99_007469 [Puccinia graminis f. sp. tritici]
MAQHYHQSHALRLFAAGGNQINLCKDLNTAQTLVIQHIFGHLIILDHQDSSNYLDLPNIDPEDTSTRESFLIIPPPFQQRRAFFNLLCHKLKPPSHQGAYILVPPIPRTEERVLGNSVLEPWSSSVPASPSACSI